jgi:hypothetical protein
MSDRYILMANSAGRFQLMAIYSINGYEWRNENGFLIRPTNTGIPVWEGGGKSGGASYPDVIELQNGQYLAAYGERGKEILSVSRWSPESMRSTGNLIAKANDFPSTYWTKTRSTATWYAEDAPDGHPGGTLLAATAVASTHLIHTAVAASFSGEHTMSIYVKPTANGNFPQLRIVESTGIAFATFDYDTLSVGSSGGSAFISAAIAAVGSGWYRISMTFSHGSAFRWGVSISETNNSTEAPAFTATTADALYIWGARLEAGSTATPFLADGSY